MSTFCFSPSKKILQLLLPQKFSIFTFGPSFKVNSHVEFIFLIKFSIKIHNIIRISPKKINNFLTKHEFNMNFYIFYS